LIKQLLLKLAFGLLFGTGLGVALAGVIFAVDTFHSSATPQPRNAVAQPTAFQDFQSQSGVSIKASEARKGKFNTVFIGTIKNDGKDAWRNLYIVVELFDKSGKFVDKCAAYDGSNVVPGQERHFKVSCEGCSDNALVQFDKYTIKVESGILAQR
jgi:hypothetical protein